MTVLSLYEVILACSICHSLFLFFSPSLLSLSEVQSMTSRTASVVVLVLAALVAASFAGSCTTQITNSLKDASVLLCGRMNGGMPGARFTQLLQPGQSYQYACPQLTQSTSYEVYFALRNDTQCTWDGPCSVNTGTCKSYPWVLGEGVSWQNGYWYGFVAANFDGGIGFDGNYGAADVKYGVQLNCSSYGVKPWSGTCGVSGDSPYCVPNAPAPTGQPDSGVVCCGPKNNQGLLTVNIFSS